MYSRFQYACNMKRFVTLPYFQCPSRVSKRTEHDATSPDDNVCEHHFEMAFQIRGRHVLVFLLVFLKDQLADRSGNVTSSDLLY